MANLQDFLQSMSNSAASNVSAPVDGINWLLRKAGLPVSDEPVLGGDWLAKNGYTRPVEQNAASLAGETAAMLAPFAVAAKAPQIARGLLQAGENVAAPAVLNKQAGALRIGDAKAKGEGLLGDTQYPIITPMKTVKKSEMPPESDGHKRLYHGGSGQPSGKDFNKVPSGGTYDGFFALGTPEGSWGGHGTGHDYFADIPNNKLLSDYDLNYEVPYEKTLSAFKKVTGISDDSEVFEPLWKSVIEDNHQKYHDDLNGFLGDDIGQASNKAQKLRGQIAKKLGYKAVQMTDEHGPGTWLMVPGVQIKRAY